MYLTLPTYLLLSFRAADCGFSLARICLVTSATVLNAARPVLLSAARSSAEAGAESSVRSSIRITACFVSALVASLFISTASSRAARTALGKVGNDFRSLQLNLCSRFHA